MKTKYSYKQIWTISYPIYQSDYGTDDWYDGHCFSGTCRRNRIRCFRHCRCILPCPFHDGIRFSIGAQILIARRNGEGNYKEIGPIFYQGIYFLLAMAVILFTFSIVFSPYILKNIISSPHIYDAAESYIHWRVYGFFFSFVMVMFRAFFVGTTQTKTLTLNSIVMVLSNVVFNYILIFGKFGFPQLGIAGAAIGSSLAEMVSVIFFIIYTWKRIDCRKYALNILPKFQGKTLKRILNCFCVDNDSELCFFVYLVYVLSICGTFGRALFGNREHYPKRVGNPVYDCNGICIHLWFIGQQSDRCR